MSHFSVLVIGDDVEAAMRPFQENNMSDCPKELLVFTEDEDFDFDPKNGKRGYWENPNAKWDYWREGGRFAGKLAIKGENGLYNTALIGELDFGAMREDRKSSAGHCYDAARRELGSGDSEGITEYIFGVNPNKISRDNFIAQQASKPVLQTFAVVKDGQWYQRGEMGWWGVVHDEKDEEKWNAEFEALIQSLDPNTRVTVVDCHI